MELNVTVRKKVAMAEKMPIIRDNGDYTVRFDWDDEWDGLNPVMLVVCPNGATYMQEISGNVAPLPALRTDWVMIGLASGDIHTTTGAMFRCVPSVRSGSTTQVDPPEDVYAQLLAMYQSKVSEPATEGTAGQVLATDGNGGRYWKDSGTKIETDATPTQGSTNPVQSGGVYDALQELSKTVDDKIAEIPTPDVSGQITQHNENTEAHPDIREALAEKLDKENPTGTGGFSLNRKADTTVGAKSVAMGDNNEASGYAAYAEGNKVAAKAYCTHAEGNNTVANSKSQHVEGEWNVEDPAPNETGRGTYAHIVGNGFDSGRSNAYTLDWDGVPWYQGRPQFGGNAQDDGSQTVMANGDTEVVLKSASKKWKITVDDTGALTTTEVTE